MTTTIRLNAMQSAVSIQLQIADDRSSCSCCAQFTHHIHFVFCIWFDEMRTFYTCGRFITEKQCKCLCSVERCRKKCLRYTFMMTHLCGETEWFTYHESFYLIRFESWNCIEVKQNRESIRFEHKYNAAEMARHLITKSALLFVNCLKISSFEIITITMWADAIVISIDVRFSWTLQGAVYFLTCQF